MSRRTYESTVQTIPPDVGPDSPRFLEVLNDRLSSLAGAVDALRGLAGTIKIAADIDMGGFAILNAKGGGSGADVLTQQDADARYLRNIRAMIERELAKRPTASAGAGTATVHDVTLTADYTLNSPVPFPATGDSLSVHVTQDGTGGWTLTLGTGFDSSCVSDINGDPNKRTHLRFVAGTDGSWYMDGEPWTQL